MMIDLFELKSGQIHLNENILRFTNHNKKDSVIVIFSSFAAKDYGPRAFSYIKHFSLVHDRCDLVFIKDPRNQWYNKGISGLGSNLDECVNSLFKITKEYSRSVFFGSSMGAYASLLFGQRCKATSVISLAPQTFLAAPYPRFNPKIHHGSYVDLSVESNPQNTEKLVVIGEEELFDIYQLNRLSDDSQLRRISVPGAHHNVVKFLDDRGLLQGLAEAIADDQMDQYNRKLEELVRSSRIDWQSKDKDATETIDSVAIALEAFYAGDLDLARTRLEQLLNDHPNWLGVLLLLADIYFQQSDPEKALQCLYEVRAQSSFIDGYQALMSACQQQLERSQGPMASP